ncbi:ATP-binding protein [Xylocopilactobacillus apicola]|uniref:IstB-like ATP-binding domain-containing protein n=1 Tax=Xylocopilactobacillus apicola TaxID=2932184 RepID=A0AAU9DW48_9LACO|nr:ATP-binding protein [Xylocopilactobacillus apicola]BDR59708.1 hypothetical protein XA3_21490 [Xylocopilactobacillus apicola]
MITDETKRKLRELRLTAMAEALEIQEQNPDYQGMSFDDRFQLIVDGAYDNQQSNRLTRLIRQANFSTHEPCVSDIDYREDRQLDRNLILSLATGNYIKESHNIILKGAAGCGKTWMAIALGTEACQQFYKVKYLRLPELLDDLAVAKHEANGDFRKIIERYKKVNLLIIDEWMLTPINDEQAQIILELVECQERCFHALIFRNIFVFFSRILIQLISFLFSFLS